MRVFFPHLLATAALLVGLAAHAAELGSASYTVRGSSLAPSVAPDFGGGAGGTLGEAGPVGLATAPSGLTVEAGFWAIAQRERIGVCGDSELGLYEECDDGGTVSGDGCWATCELEDEQQFHGIAIGGYLVEVEVDGVPIGIITGAGQTAAEVAEELAARINADLTLQGLGVSALAADGRLVTNGAISYVDNQDPGLVAPLVPSLAPGLIAVLGMMLGGSGLWALRRSSFRFRSRRASFPDA